MGREKAKVGLLQVSEKGDDGEANRLVEGLVNGSDGQNISSDCVRRKRRGFRSPIIKAPF
jgi:hypothetical protein